VNKQISEYDKGPTLPYSHQKDVQRQQSLLHSKREDQTVLAPDERKRREQQQNANYADFENKIVLTPELRKKAERKTNRKISEYEQKTVLAPDAKKDMAKKANTEISDYELKMVLAPNARKERNKKTNEKISNYELKRVLSIEARLRKYKNTNEKLADFEPKRVLTREEQRNKMQSQSESLSELIVGNTMDRKSYIEMLKKRSKEFASNEPGYQNTSAERKARIRKFFYPKQYQATTPGAKKERAKDISQKLADYSGEIKLREKTKYMHPSARHLDRLKIKSIEDKEALRLKMLKKNRKDWLSDQPLYMKQKVARARYDKKTEKGLWNE
jgi:hypothetical protein